MISRRSTVAALAGAALLGGRGAQAQPTPGAVPAGYPAGYAEVVAKARAEGKLSIYTSTDLAQGQKLMDAYKAAYPGIAVEWNDQGTTAVFNRVISEAAARQMGGDIAWSSALDLQLSLVDRGLATPHRSPEADKLPPWAAYKDSAYGTSLEAASVIYNKRLLPAAQVPKDFTGLGQVLRENKAALEGKVATYDPEKSGVGFMFATNSLAHRPNFWEVMTAFGAAKGKVYGGSGSMREKVASGEHLMAFDVIGSYAVEWAKADPNIGVAYLADHVPGFARPMLITKGAPHPNAAQLFLDFTLSPPGQRAMTESGLSAIRTDVPGVPGADALNQQVGGKLLPIPLDAKLTEGLDPKKRAEFFRQWRRAMQG